MPSLATWAFLSAPMLNLVDAIKGIDWTVLSDQVTCICHKFAVGRGKDQDTACLDAACRLYLSRLGQLKEGLKPNISIA